MRQIIKKYFAGLTLLLLVILIGTAIKQATQINIGNQSATVLDLVTENAADTTSGYAWNDNVGWINFGDGTGNVEGQVYVSNGKLYGYAWGENIGWISLNCENDDSCETVDYSVTQNDSNGILTGYAWGENIGWIDFAPSGGGVTISTSTTEENSFSGYAWGENIGWISFNCENDDSCATADYGVTTAWMAPLYTLTYIAGANGTITGLTTQSVAYGDDGTTVTAVANSGYHFTRWSDNAPLTSRTDTNVTGDIAVTATFVINGNSGGGKITCTEFTYIWGACVGGNQTATVATSLPEDCTGGTPLTSRVCENVITTPITITVIPNSIDVHVNEISSFSANVSGTTSPIIIWSISEGVTAGTITSLNNLTGRFVASSALGTYHIIATLASDQTKTATATVTVSPLDQILPVNITIDPKNIQVYVNEGILFKSFITNTDNKNTTWIVAEEGGGNIDDNGLYTAPNIAGVFHIIAKAQADINKTDQATVDVRLRPADNKEPDSKDNNNGGTGNKTNDSPTSILTPITKNLNLIILGTTTEQIINDVVNIADSGAGSTVVNTFTTAGIVSSGIGASAIIVLNPAVVADILLMPFRLWSLLLSALGLRKRHRPWGTVYDSVTKQPIDPAYVTLKKIGHKAEENMSITDLDGRYGFLVAPGTYHLTASKTNYVFPSKKLAGQTADVLYSNLYFGEKIKVETNGAVIQKNIPLDPVNFDWNEFIKKEKKMTKFYSKKEKTIRIVTDWVFRLGFLVSLASIILVTAPYNFVIFGLYIILTILRKFGLRTKSYGQLTNKKGTPLSFAVIRVISPDLNIEITHKVADKIGRYYCLVPKGKYYVKVEQKNNDESYSLAYTSPIFETPNGIINSNFICN